MKIASRTTPEGLVGHMWPTGHGLSTTALWHHTSNLISWKRCNKDF